MADLVVLDAEPLSDDLNETLEHVLAKAKAGELSSVAIAYVYRDGAIGRAWSKTPSFATLLGSVARLMHLLNIDRDAE